MSQQNFSFWTCPECIHVQALDMDRMSNRCRLIDQGESPVDGAAWEYQDCDLCPAFEQHESHQTAILPAHNPSAVNS
jgi:hypothetical protein